MNLVDAAKRDAAAILGNKSSGFAVELKFTAPDDTTATINGRAYKHHLAVDGDGNTVKANSANMHITFAESALTAVEYETRNANNDVKLKGHLVAWTDSSGTEKTYKICGSLKIIESFFSAYQ